MNWLTRIFKSSSKPQNKPENKPEKKYGVRIRQFMSTSHYMFVEVTLDGNHYTRVTKAIEGVSLRHQSERDQPVLLDSADAAESFVKRVIPTLEDYNRFVQAQDREWERLEAIRMNNLKALEQKCQTKIII